MRAPIVHVEIIGRDATRLRAFYREAFGWEFDDPVPGAGLSEYTLVHGVVHDEPITAGIGSNPDGYAGHLTFYVQVESLERTLETIERLGGRRMMPPETVAGGRRVSLFLDPEGRVVGLSEAVGAIG